MSVTGKVREQKEWKKSTGFFETEVLCINPDREKLEQLLGVTLEKDPEYLGTGEEEVELADGSKKKIPYTKLDLVFWLRDVKSDAKRSVRFYLRDLPKVNQGKTKTQYINNIGTLSWADVPDNLPEWFKERPFRVAHQGEEDLYAFVSCWLGKVDFKDPEASLDFDWVKLMKGNVKELTEQINSDYSSTVVCLSIITSSDKSGEKKEYEQIYNREFLPGYIIKDIRLKNLPDDVFIERATATEKKKRSRLQRFILSVKDAEYGIKDYFTLGELKEYDPADNIVATDTTHIKDGNISY